MKLVVLILLGFLFTGSSLNDGRKANEAFQRGDYAKAVRLYRQAIEQNPDDARLYFNLGNALSELGETEEAIEVYNQYKSKSENVEQQALADYNQGRLLTENEQYDEALKYYRDALRKNPDDADARHNFELALKKQQEQEEQQSEEDPEDQSNEDQEQDGDQDQEQNDQEQENQDQQEDQNQNQNQQSDSQEEQDGEEQQQPQPDSMSREEAENLLDALGQLERELLEGRKKEATESSSNNDRDW